MPRAIKRVFWRLLCFYVLGIFIIRCVAARLPSPAFDLLYRNPMRRLTLSVLVPYNEPLLLNGHEDASASPFVIAIQNAGIVGLPSVINAVILLAAWSAGNSDVYAASRTLYALALQDQAPRVFRRCTKNGLPIWCVLVTSAFGALCYMNTGGAKAVEAFTWLYNISSIAAIVTWW